VRGNKTEREREREKERDREREREEERRERKKGRKRKFESLRFRSSFLMIFPTFQYHQTEDQGYNIWACGGHSRSKLHQASSMYK
jgi:hypothetical protein